MSRVGRPTSAARGTGTATRAPAATSRPPTTPSASTPSSRREWTWSEKYATQPEILAYLQHVADRYDLRRDIRFSTRVDRGDVGRRHLDAGRSRTDQGDDRHLPLLRHGHRVPVGAQGRPTSPGAERFQGDVYFTSRWPHEGVDFTGKRVARDRHRLVGHPVDPAHRRAGRAAHGLPAHAQLLDARPQRPGAARARAGRSSATGPPTAQAAKLVARRRAARGAPRTRRASAPAEEQRRQRFEAAWDAGELFAHPRLFADHDDEPAGQRRRGRVHPREDPLDRGGSRDGRGALPHRASRSAPSGRASTPATTRRSTCPTCGWSTCASTRSTTITATGIDTERRDASSSTPSSSPPASTP